MKNKKLYWLIPLMTLAVIVLLALEGRAGIVRNATSSQNGQDSLSVPLYVLDTAGNRIDFDTTADWGYIVTRYSNGTKAVSDSFMIRGTNTPKIVKNAAEFGGFVQFSYRKQISDLDGTPTNGTYSYEVTVRDSSLKLWTVCKVGEFQLYQSKTFADAIDSVTIDGSHLAGLTASISATTIAADAIGSSEIATDAIGAAEIAADAIGASELAANSITSSEIADNAIDAGAIAADAIGASEIAADAIGASEIADNAIDSTAFATSAKTGLAHYVWGSATRTLTSAGSGGITEAEMWDMLDTAFVNAFRIGLGDSLGTFVTPESMAIIFWSYVSRTLTELDEDNTTIDLNGTTIGTVTTATNVTTVNGLAANVITATSIAADAIGASEIAADAIGASEIAADAVGSSEVATSGVNEIVDQTWDEIIGGSHEISGSSGQLLVDGNTGITLMYSNGVKLLAGGTEADTSFTNLQEAVAGISLGGGLTASDIDSIRDVVGDTGRVYAGSGGSADIYPLSGIAIEIDGPGEDANAQFVTDTVALGGLSSHEETLINRLLIVRSLSGIEVQVPVTITRVAYNAANCSLTVNFDMPIDFADGDSIQFTGLWHHNFATLAEANDSAVLALLEADTAGHGGDATIGGAIVAPKGDTLAIKAMLANNEYARAKDSTLEQSETATSVGVLRRGEIVTKAQVVDSIKNTPLIVGGGYIDTTGELLEEIAGSGSGGCPDSVGYAVTLVAYDSLALAPVQSAQMALRSSINGADLAVSSLTGVSGSFTFTIATPATYYVITRAAGMTFPVRTLVVTGAQVDSVNGAGYTVSGHATVVGSVDCIWCDVRFVLESAGQPVTDTSTGLLVTQTVVDTTTNSFGDFTMGLPKTGNMVYVSGSLRKHPQWRVKVSPTDVEKEVKWEKLFDIPADSTGVNLRYVR